MIPQEWLKDIRFLPSTENQYCIIAEFEHPRRPTGATADDFIQVTGSMEFTIDKRRLLIERIILDASSFWKGEGATREETTIAYSNFEDSQVN